MDHGPPPPFAPIPALFAATSAAHGPPPRFWASAAESVRGRHAKGQVNSKCPRRDHRQANIMPYRAAFDTLFTKYVILHINC